MHPTALAAREERMSVGTKVATDQREERGIPTPRTKVRSIHDICLEVTRGLLQETSPTSRHSLNGVLSVSTSACRECPNLCTSARSVHCTSIWLGGFSIGACYEAGTLKKRHDGKCAEESGFIMCQNTICRPKL